MSTIGQAMPESENVLIGSVSAQSQCGATPYREAYTLIEVLLVLSVLAVLAGITMPSVLSFVSEHGLRDAAETVRSELDLTRFRSIDSGLRYQFRYEPNGTHFIAIPAERPLTLPSQGPAITTTDSSFLTISGELRDGLIFMGPAGVPSVGQSIGMEWFEGIPEGASLQRIQWSLPIEYRTDGTADTASFRVCDEKNRYVELSIRGITGIATSSPVRQEANTWD